MKWDVNEKDVNSDYINYQRDDRQYLSPISG